MGRYGKIYFWKIKVVIVEFKSISPRFNIFLSLLKINKDHKQCSSRVQTRSRFGSLTDFSTDISKSRQTVIISR